MNTKDAVHSFCHCIPNKWHLMSVMLSASNCLDWISSITGTSISDTLKNVENFSKDIDNISNAPYFLPYLSGERTPHNNPHVRGSFHFIKTTTKATNLQYAVLEGISFGILDGVTSISKVNNNFKDIFVVGGGSRSSFWINLLASVLNRNLHVCEQSEYGAALGVARLAMFVDNEIAEKENIIKKIKINKDYFPKDNFLNILQKRYQIWKNIYSSNDQVINLYNSI